MSLTKSLLWKAVSGLAFFTFAAASGAQTVKVDVKGLAVQLEDFIRDESNHVEETARILKDWPL